VCRLAGIVDFHTILRKSSKKQNDLWCKLIKLAAKTEYGLAFTAGNQAGIGSDN